MKFRTALLLLVSGLVLLSYAAFAQEDVSNDAKMDFNAGNKAFKEGRTDLAIEKYKAAVEKAPGFALAYYWMGNAYKKQKDYVNASNAYQSAIEKDSKLSKAYIALGNVQSYQRKYNEALNSYQAAINIDPSAKKAYWGKGEVYFKQENYEKAVENYRAAVGLEPSSGLVHGNSLKGLGLALKELGNFQEAAGALEEALNHLRTRSQKAAVYLRIGDSYRELKNYDSALSAYQNCLSNARRSIIKASANFGMAEIYKKQGKTSLAIKHYQEAAKDRNWKQAAEYEIDILKNPDKYAY